MTLPELSIRRPVTASVLLISICVIGLIAVNRLPLAFMPEMEAKQVFVIVDYPNASPAAVERLIVRPVEEAISSISGVKHMWSMSDGNGGRVSINLDYDTDMDRVRTEVLERVDRIRSDLPEDVERIRISPSWNPRETGETIMEARLSSGRDLSSDYELLERKIIRPLERIPGVASVLLDGVNPREVKINLKLNALKAHRLDARIVLDTLNRNNLDKSIGVLRKEGSRYTLRTQGSFVSVDQIRNLPLAGTNLRIRDVASVTYKEPPLEYGRLLDGEFAIGLSITKESSANTVAVCDAIRERVAGMGSDAELDGINFLVWEDQGREIMRTLDELQNTGLVGAILASLVLFLFLRRIGTTLVGVLCIPFSLIVACFIIWAQGKSLNTISLLGLIVGIGMLVDNAVVIMENIDRYQRKGYNSRVSALLGAREVSVAVMAATLTSVIVFLPLIFSEASEMNTILRELAFTVSFTLLASLFISQTLIPLATAKLLKAKTEVRPPGMIMAFLERWYTKLLALSLRYRWVIPVLGLAVIGTAYYPYDNVEMNLQPNKSEMFVGMRYRFSESLSLQRKKEVIVGVESELAKYKDQFEVKSIYSWYSENWCLTRLYMKEDFTHEEHMAKVRRELPALLPEVAGVKIEVQDSAPFWERNRGKRVAFELQGPDSEKLAEIATEAQKILETMPGLQDVYSTAEGGNLELHTQIDRERARAYGVDLSRPAETVELTFRGRRLPRFKGPDGEVEMRLVLEEQEFDSMDRLKALPVQREGAASVPLESFAEFTVKKGPDRIHRNNKITGIWVGAKYSEGKKEDYRKAIRAEFEQMDLPYGYRWDFQSFRRQERETQSEMAVNLVLALFLIFGVMAALFESFSQAISLTVALPFALAGALWALFLFDTDFDQPALVGTLLLLGVVVNNGIVMIEHINKYRREGYPREKAMIRGGRERLRPILMTAMTTLMSLVPIAIEKPALAGVYYYSMAYVLMGGLIVSTVLTTLFLPATVTIVEDIVNWFGKRFSAAWRLTKNLIPPRLRTYP